MNFSKEFIECLISANKFTAKHSDTLKYVSIQQIGDSHQICGTDGFALVAYTLMNDNNEFLNGFADLTNVKFPKKYEINGASLLKTNDLNTIMVSYSVGKKIEQTFIPIIKDIVYPNYAKLLDVTSVYNKNNTDSIHGEFLIEMQDILKVLNVIDTNYVDRIELTPTEECPFDTHKDDGIECGIYVVDERRKVAAFNIRTTTRVREYPRISNVALNPSLLKLIFQEAEKKCHVYTILYLSGKLSPVHVKGNSGNLFLRSEYLLMPMNRG